MRWIVHKVATDGTCFFRAVLQALRYPDRIPRSQIEQEIHELKRKIHRHVCEQNAGRYYNVFLQPAVLNSTAVKKVVGEKAKKVTPKSRGEEAENLSMAAYCAPDSRLFRTDFYAGYLEGIAAARALGITIVVHDKRGDAAQDDKIYRPDGVSSKTIHLLYNGYNHYEWLEKPSSASKNIPTTWNAHNNTASVYWWEDESQNAVSLTPSSSVKASSSVGSSSPAAVNKPFYNNRQANYIARRYFSTLGLRPSNDAMIRNELRATPFNNNHRQFLRNHGYDAAANNSNALVLAHMVRAMHVNRASRKLANSWLQQPATKRMARGVSFN